MAETWTSVVTGNSEIATVTGRNRVPITKKINPIWWFGNDPEPNPPDWYLPASARWWRVVCWYFRNPLVNFNDYVTGVCDRDYSVGGPYPVMVPDWLDQGKEGWKWSVVQTAIPRPFLSYTGKKHGAWRVLWHVGWEPGGSFALKFNLTKD